MAGEAGGANVAVDDKLAAEAIPPDERIEVRQSFAEAREDVMRFRAGESSPVPAPPCPLAEELKVEGEGLPPMKPRNDAFLLVPITVTADEEDEEEEKEVPVVVTLESAAFPEEASDADSDKPIAGVSAAAVIIPVSQSLNPPSKAPVMIKLGAARG